MHFNYWLNKTNVFPASVSCAFLTVFVCILQRLEVFQRKYLWSTLPPVFWKLTVREDTEKSWRFWAFCDKLFFQKNWNERIYDVVPWCGFFDLDITIINHLLSLQDKENVQTNGYTAPSSAHFILLHGIYLETYWRINEELMAVSENRGDYRELLKVR